MPPPNQKIIFLRRISALLIFTVVLFAFAILFYFKYIPGNKEELNQRGHRVLTQVIQNFQNKDDELREIICNATQEDPNELYAQEGSYARLNENIAYDILRSNFFPANNFSSLYRMDNGDWHLLYKTDTATRNTKPYISVSMQEFAGPILSTREDIFQNYFILLDSAIDQRDPRKHAYYLLFKKDPVSASADLNVDTLQLLEKNSDKSGICDVSIAGNKYVLFFAPFLFQNSCILMAGLIPEKIYNQKVQSTPLYSLSITIILISLILSALPLFKIFLLSPNESICSTDVLKTAVSFYIGAIIITIIAFYGFVVYVTDMSLQQRLRQFSTEIRKDIENEFDMADRQITYYKTVIGSRSISDSVKTNLIRKKFKTSKATGRQIDSVCSPRIFPNVSRLIWGDTGGNTVAKWSPFTYNTPFTELSNYQFFKLLDQKPSYLDGTAGVEKPVIYPGKSNLTDEFLTCIARRSNAGFQTGQSSFIVLVAMLHSAILPIVPKGFGFAVIDHTGKILIDADPNRDLSENLFQESGYNQLLAEMVRDRRSDLNFKMELYGEPYIARVAPIADQPLTLVCYYDEQTLSGHIFRYLHFSIHTLFIMLTLLIACLLLSTFKEWSPTLLNFKINKTEWIRPSSKNAEERPFIFVYLAYLLVLTILFLSLIAGLSKNLDNIFYISMLLPFYVVIGVQVSEVPYTEKYFYLIGYYVKAAKYPLVCVFILNVVICLLMTNSGLDRINFFVPLIFQLCILLVKPLVFWEVLGPWIKKKEKETKMDFFQNSVYLSILLISVLPTLGTLTYGFYAEKIQFKKDKLLNLSVDFFERSNYLLNDYLPTIKPEVLSQLGPHYQDSLVYATSIYLTDRDTIVRWQPDTINTKDYLSDGLYSMLMDKVYLAPQIWGDDVCIQDTAGDRYWSYKASAAPDTSRGLAGPAIVYAEDRPVRDLVAADNHIRLISPLQKPQQDFSNLSKNFKFFFILAIASILFLARRVIHEAIQRLFLLDVVKQDKIFVEKDYLNKFFEPSNMPSNTSYVKNLSLPDPFTTDFFNHERGFDDWKGRPKPFLKEEFILAMADYFGPIYESIWYDISDEEKYILYDFSSDRYTNYKNSTVLYKLINKGILKQEGECLDVFSFSFRQYVLSLENTDAVDKLKDKFKISGTWDSIRIPVVAILAVVAVFLFMTQAAFSSGIVAAITALSTIVPMLVRVFTKPNAAA